MRRDSRRAGVVARVSHGRRGVRAFWVQPVAEPVRWVLIQVMTCSDEVEVALEQIVVAGENVLVSGFIVPGTAQFTGCFGRFVRKEPRNNTVTTKFWRGANFSER